MQKLGRVFSFLFNAFLALFFVGAAIPGTHRVVCPDCFGLVEIAPRVWTDRPSKGIELLSLRSQAQTKVADFFKDAPPNPTTIFCTTKTCAQTFGIGGNGLSISDMVVMFSPGGLTLGTMTHEMTHSRLHRNMGLRNIWAQPFPSWFDEGLATHVAGHPNTGRVARAEERRRVQQARRVWQWGSTMRALGVGQAYAAAAAEVAALEARLGRDGLLDIIERADKGENFDSLIKK